MGRARVGVLISGRGSNLQALIAACEAPDYPAEIALVIANVADAKGLEHAKRAGISFCVISHKDFPDRAGFDAALDSALRQANIGIICLAGFMRLLGEKFTTAWRDRVLNIHPSLLPAFPGLNTHRKVIEAGVKISGCTVHLVRPELDAGPILIQAAVPVAQDDTPETLAARVLTMEHRCYPMALRLLATNGVRVEENRTRLAATPATPAAGFLNPETQG
ncbi:MAG: phosphoribosylglycinamide formyltransferase [Rhodospirillaceae bacterium]|nr:MAG: phosphoribosylglycinamide formyltransferase [Rhodospirillaceae bacterium]